MVLSWIQLASLIMFLGITLGAFGAHALKDKISVHSIEIFKTGILYHVIHALGLFIIAWLTSQSSDPKLHIAGLCFLTGIFLFSGSLYLLAVTEIKIIGIITPLGGLCFLAGWFLIMHSQIHL